MALVVGNIYDGVALGYKEKQEKICSAGAFLLLEV